MELRAAQPAGSTMGKVNPQWQVGCGMRAVSAAEQACARARWLGNAERLRWQRSADSNSHLCCRRRSWCCMARPPALPVTCMRECGLLGPPAGMLVCRLSCGPGPPHQAAHTLPLPARQLWPGDVGGPHLAAAMAYQPGVPAAHRADDGRHLGGAVGGAHTLLSTRLLPPHHRR